VHAIVELFVPIHEKKNSNNYEKKLISNVFETKDYIDLYVYIVMYLYNYNNEVIMIKKNL